jgi:hypothetical protein
MNMNRLALFGILLLSAGFSLDGALAFVGPSHGNYNQQVLPEILGRKLVISYQKKNKEIAASTFAGEGLVFLTAQSEAIRKDFFKPEWGAGEIYVHNVTHSFEHLHFIMQEIVKHQYDVVGLCKWIQTDDIIEASLCAQELKMAEFLNLIHKVLIDRIASEPLSVEAILSRAPKSIADAIRYVTNLPTNNVAHKKVCNLSDERINLVAVDSHKDIFAAASKDRVTIYDLEQECCIAAINLQSVLYEARACAVSSKHQKVIVASKIFTWDQKSTIECFDLKTGKRLWLQLIPHNVCKIIIGDDDGVISLITPQKIISLSPDGIFTQSQDHKADPQYFSVNSHPDAIKAINKLELVPNFSSKAINLDEEFIAKFSQSCIGIQDIKTHSIIGKLFCKNPISSLGISASGSIIAGDELGNVTVFKSQKLSLAQPSQPQELPVPPLQQMEQPVSISNGVVEQQHVKSSTKITTPWYNRRTTWFSATLFGAALATTAYCYRVSLGSLWARIPSFWRTSRAL